MGPATGRHNSRNSEHLKIEVFKYASWTLLHIRTNLATEWRLKPAGHSRFKLATDSHPNPAIRKLMAQPRRAAMRQEPAI